MLGTLQWIFLFYLPPCLFQPLYRYLILPSPSSFSLPIFSLSLSFLFCSLSLLYHFLCHSFAYLFFLLVFFFFLSPPSPPPSFAIPIALSLKIRISNVASLIPFIHPSSTPNDIGLYTVIPLKYLSFFVSSSLLSKMDIDQAIVLCRFSIDSRLQIQERIRVFYYAYVTEINLQYIYDKWQTSLCFY